LINHEPTTLFKLDLHPLPPIELTIGLHNTIAKDSQQGLKMNSETTYNVMTKEKTKLKRIAAISALGLIDATAWPIDV